MWKIRALTFLIVMACAPLAGAADFEKLTVPDNLALTIDPLDATGSVVISLVNKSGKTSRIDLQGDSLISAATHLPSHGATIQLARPGGGAETTELTSEDLPSNQELSVRVLVHNLVEPGDYNLTLLNGAVAVGQVRVSGFPFRVHPDAPTGNPVPLVMGSGYGGFTIRNDDPFTYPVKWEVSARNRKAKGTMSVGPNRSERVNFPDCSAPNQSDCQVAEAGLWDTFCLCLRDESENGHLRIHSAFGSGMNPKMAIFASLISLPRTRPSRSRPSRFSPQRCPYGRIRLKKRPWWAASF